MSGKLLLMAGTVIRRPDPGLLPAGERYDGPSFHVLRRVLAEGITPPTIFILSAEHGFLRWDDLIEYGEERMTAERRRALFPHLQKQWHDLVVPTFDDTIYCYVSMSREYRSALTDLGFWTMAQLRIPFVTFGQGGIGYQQRQLQAWLVEVH